jgi:hypothetical protein
MDTKISLVLTEPEQKMGLIRVADDDDDDGFYCHHLFIITPLVPYNTAQRFLRVYERPLHLHASESYARVPDFLA